ncbi:MAG TPA: hypothetical protein VEC92_01890 [Nitrososphaerales archaeon]|nr:hypothetical protein [Nitrososphaerales archaeon]
MKTSSIFGLVTALSVVAVLAISVSLPRGQASPSAPQSSTSAHQAASNGLLLQLSISSSVVGPGQPLLVSIDSFNPFAVNLNATAAKSWAAQGLKTGSCYSSVYPFGVAVYQGSYAAGNISQGKPLQVFPIVPCPLFIRLVTGYYFNPESSNAIVLPGTGAAILMSASVNVTGTFPGKGGSAQPFPPGIYTVVGGDEWGTLVFLQFRVLPA